MDMNEMFRKECEELGIDYSEFPYDFPEGHRIHYPAYFAAIMWILKKRQDKMFELQPHLVTFDENGNEVMTGV